MKGGRPGLVVIGGDDCVRGREFESRNLILDGYFSTFLVVQLALLIDRK